MENNLISIEKKIIAKYEKANFIQSHYPETNILRFSNDFSIHFIFLLNEITYLKENWKKLHDLLIEDYLEYTGPRYMEWNYYAVFIVNNSSIKNVDLHQLRIIIESDTSYSRKYVFTEREVHDLPPGMISEEELKSKKIATKDLFLEWEKILGPELLSKIINGPKSLLERRIRSLIEDKIEK